MSPLLNRWDVTDTWTNWLLQVEQNAARLYQFGPDLVNAPAGLFLNDALYEMYSRATILLSDKVEDWSLCPPRDSAVFQQRQEQLRTWEGHYDLPGADN